LRPKRQPDERRSYSSAPRAPACSANISTDMLARHNVTNKLHQFAQRENICLIGLRNENAEGRALGPQSMADLARCIVRAVELKSYNDRRYFRLIFERISDAAPKTHPPIPYSVEDLGGSARRILWGEVRPNPVTDALDGQANGEADQ
jgi:hypothetical protein